LWVIDDAGNGVIDVQTGAWKWRSASPALATSHGRVIVPEEQLMLDYVAEDDKHSVLYGVEIETGRVRWHLDNLFAERPLTFEVECCAGRKFGAIEGNQAPLFADSTLVIWMSEDGPIALNINTGAVLWRGTSLKGKHPPAAREGYGRMMAAHG